MDRKPPFRRKTAISYKTEEKTVMRGYDLSELAEEGYSRKTKKKCSNTRWEFFWSIPCRRRQ
jgi:hypothetical protein